MFEISIHMYCGCTFSLLRIFSTTFIDATLAVSPGQPSLISDDADVVALIGTSKDLAKQINQKEVHWGVCYASARLLSTYARPKLQIKPFAFHMFPISSAHMLSCTSLIKVLLCSCLKILLKSEWRRH